MSTNRNLTNVSADACAADQNIPLPEWSVPSLMAFHIVFDGHLDINGRLNPDIRPPYRRI